MKKISLILLSAIAVIALAACQQDKATVKEDYVPGDPWKLVWSDEFNGTNLDTSKWNFEKIYVNRELQHYTETNAFVSNGHLVVLTTRVSDLFFSSRLTTENKFSCTYGKIVARIRVPHGTGMWPAFWMLGTNRPSANWPQCGEIDIMEVKGGDEGDFIVMGTAHWHADGRHVYYGGSELLETPLYQNFHNYELEWDDQAMRFKIDGKEYHKVMIDTDNMAAFHKPFYIILNVAVGGMFARIYSPGGVLADFPQTMTVDWVRVYQK